MPRLAENHYGKSRVRLLKVTRSEDAHRVSDWTLGVYLTGDFQSCFLDGDNTGLLATDTMKNTVYALARMSSAASIEDFALELASFLSDRNPQVSKVRIEIDEKCWTHLEIGKLPCPTAFIQHGPELATSLISLRRGSAPVIDSGVKGLIILKTAHSAFTGFKRDDLTTLPETNDRLLGTEATVMWRYFRAPADFTGTRRRILDTVLETFAQHDSLSVQQTLFAMASAALAAEPLLAELTLTMPNRHNIPIDFSRFASPFHSGNDNTIFVPQDDPAGHIHARVVR